MENPKIKANLDFKKLEDLGYSYSIVEGGYVSEDGATIISTDRMPYKRQVMQYKSNVETEHMKNIEQLKNIKVLE